MTESTTRRKFLKMLGLSAGATLTASSVLGTESERILTLNKEQQEFMLLYERWMDEYIKVIHIQKADPHNAANHKRMLELSEIADEWKGQLRTFMQDKNFSIIYQASIERMKKEI